MGMYLRKTKRKNKDGSTTEYYQLAHNERHPVTKRTVAKIIHSFGRTDAIDRDGLVRLCRSIARVCSLRVIDPMDEEYPRQFTSSIGLPENLKLKKTTALGCVLAIEAMWERLGIKEFLCKISRKGRQMVPHERALFAMTANRLCEPDSKLARLPHFGSQTPVNIAPFSACPYKIAACFDAKRCMKMEPCLLACPICCRFSPVPPPVSRPFLCDASCPGLLATK